MCLLGDGGAAEDSKNWTTMDEWKPLTSSGGKATCVCCASIAISIFMTDWKVSPIVRGPYQQTYSEEEIPASACLVF